jgi:hypothetical protein
MDPRNTQRGGAEAWGPPLDFASGWSIFWAAGESFEARTPIPRRLMNPSLPAVERMSQSFQGESEPITVVVTTWDEHHCCFGLSCRMIVPTPSAGGLR